MRKLVNGLLRNVMILWVWVCCLCARSVRREMDSDAEATDQMIQDLKAASDPLYMPDPDPNKIPVNRNLTRKAGYLNTRKYNSISRRVNISVFQSSACLIISCFCPPVKQVWCRLLGSVSISSRREETSWANRVEMWPEVSLWTSTTALSWRWTVRTDASAFRSQRLMARSKILSAQICLLQFLLLYILQ